MSSTFGYDEFNELALEMIKETGRDTVFQRVVQAPTDPQKPWLGAGARVVSKTITAPATFVPIAGKRELGEYGVTDEMLARCERTLWVAAGSGVDDSYNVVLDGGTAWHVEFVRTLKPAETPLVLFMGLKR